MKKKTLQYYSLNDCIAKFCHCDEADKVIEALASTFQFGGALNTATIINGDEFKKALYNAVPSVNTTKVEAAIKNEDLIDLES